MIERAQGFAAARRPILAVDEQDVGPAVAVRVKESRAGAQGLGQKFLAGPAAVVRELDSRSARYIGKLHVAR